MAILTLAAKDLRLLLRDPAARSSCSSRRCCSSSCWACARRRVRREARRAAPHLGREPRRGPSKTRQPFPEKPWSEVVIDDLSATPDIRLEIIPDRGRGREAVAQEPPRAVIVFEPDFSDRMNRCSFLTQGDPPPINPLGRDGVRIGRTRADDARGQDAAGLRGGHRAGDAGDAAPRGDPVDDRPGVRARRRRAVHGRWSPSGSTR